MTVDRVFGEILYVLANCIADSILLHRCFVIWKSMKRLSIIPLFLATNGTVAQLFSHIETNTLTALGLVRHSMYSAAIGMKQYEKTLPLTLIIAGYNIANAINTAILTLVIACRIWWMMRDARNFMGQEVERTYKRIILILAESGFLHSASIIANESVIQSPRSLGFGLDLNATVSLMVGIAPTLIILRTSLGLTKSAVPNSRMLSTLRFGDPPAATNGQNSEVRSIDLEQGSANGSEKSEAQKIERSDASNA
ncbi:hypothetical protein WG66_006529 [Moniliophthora roreri]|nr:hypothetical protein WG66_006529 [Moniliophthora roreri]